ncbi:hypothetical protein PILCRDRAFT_465528 [Piloderma croceum F 1598]|uniref:Uncharacterized protein n=1 Tax=Piloderma croceum (strain F 1598) TaxID=765440 RepID=A0A0C3FCU8_PILCF|nr:hypothetical protein PILCRDRAFT_465528 [Piloderma croceum F 1598]
MFAAQHWLNNACFETRCHPIQPLRLRLQLRLKAFVFVRGLWRSFVHSSLFCAEIPFFFLVFSVLSLLWCWCWRREGNSLDLQTWPSKLFDGNISSILDGRARYYNSLMTTPNLLNSTNTQGPFKYLTMCKGLVYQLHKPTLYVK